MRTRRATRWATALGAAVLTATTVTAGAFPATAAAQAPSYRNSPIVGSLVGTLNPTATNVPVYVRTSAPCPAGTQAIEGAMYSSAAAGWTEIPAVADQAFDTIDSGGVVLNNNLLGIAAANGLTLANGHYELAVACFIDPYGDGAAQYNGGFTVTGTTVTWDVAAPAATTTTIAATPASSATAGTAVQLTATVSPAAAGTVQFVDGPDGATSNLGAPVTVSGGTATTTLSTLAVGSHALRAVFTPSDPAGYAPSTSAALSYTITAAPQQPAATTTTIAASPADTAEQGAPVTFTATIAPASAAGTVQFLDGPDGSAVNLGSPATVTNGTATVTTSSLSAGTHLVRAAFTPSDTAAYAASASSALTYTVTAVAQQPTGTTTTLAASPASPAPAGSDVTLTATVSPAGAAGQLQFIDGPDGSVVNVGDPVTVTGGTGSLTTSSLAVGGHSLRAVFTPDDATAYSASTSGPVAYQITEATQEPAGTTTTLTAQPAGSAAVGAAVTFTATVTPAGAPGTVTFTDTVDGAQTPLGDPVPVSSGVAATTTSTLAEGGHQVRATFTPDDPARYATSRSSALTYTITPSGGTTAHRTSVSLHATLVRCVEERCCWTAWHRGRQEPRTALLTAYVHPRRAAGTVQFFETVGGVTTPVGDPVLVRHGLAVTSVSSLPDGAHVFTARFVPTDSAAFDGSTSRSVRVVVGHRRSRW